MERADFAEAARNARNSVVVVANERVVLENSELRLRNDFALASISAAALAVRLRAVGVATQFALAAAGKAH